ncbi:hypothetical protein [Modestobacter altitudinis]|uniref:hypothetical protein n=1 Tax=Modestobacter altitudinis TaxID=2213158 RepID=UPI00110CDDBF|nr:hypothetical protein [Modestobacter altitudinis]
MRGAAVGLVLVAVLAGCGGADQPAPPPAASSTPAAEALPEVPGVTGEAVQLRTDAALGGQVQVRLTDTGPAPFTVTSVQLDSPGFAAVPARTVAATYEPGQTIDLPTPFGTVDCTAGVEPVAARVTVVRPEGTTGELRVPLAGDTMAQVHDAACAVERVLAVVDVAVEDLTEAGTTTTGVVVLTRRSGDEPVEVTRLGGSVVLQPVLDDLPVTLEPDRDELRLPVTFDAARCDPHALAETKKPFVFPLAVTVGDGDSVPVDLPLDDAQKVQLEGFLGRVCTG